MSAPVQIPFGPRPHQRAAHALRLVIRFLVLVWHRRAGKTVFAVVELILAALEDRRPDARYAYMCPFLRQSKDVAWEYLKRFARGIPGVKPNESELSLTFPHGPVIRLYGADHPDALRGGFFDGVVLDEVGQMKPPIWGEILRPMLADRKGWALFIGTPKGVNLFSELYFRAASGKEDGWKSDLRRHGDTNALDPAEVEAARREMSPQQFAQEFDCDFFAAVENVLITLDAVQAAMKRDVKPEGFEWAAKSLGVDVARFGDDSSTIVKRQGRVSWRAEKHRGLNTMQLAARVAMTADSWGPDGIFIDTTGGLGAGVADRVRQLGYRVIDVDFGGAADNPRFKNKRAEMWWSVGEWVKDGCLPEDTELQQELVAQTYDFDPAGRLYLTSKDEVKARLGRSPDKADGLACTFHTLLAARDPMLEPRFGRAGGGGHRVATEQDPYSW